MTYGAPQFYLVTELGNTFPILTADGNYINNDVANQDGRNAFDKNSGLDLDNASYYNYEHNSRDKFVVGLKSLMPIGIIDGTQVGKGIPKKQELHHASILMNEDDSTTYNIKTDSKCTLNSSTPSCIPHKHNLSNSAIVWKSQNVIVTKDSSGFTITGGPGKALIYLGKSDKYSLSANALDARVAPVTSGVFDENKTNQKLSNTGWKFDNFYAMYDNNFSRAVHLIPNIHVEEGIDFFILPYNGNRNISEPIFKPKFGHMDQLLKTENVPSGNLNLTKIDKVRIATGSANSGKLGIFTEYPFIGGKPERWDFSTGNNTIHYTSNISHHDYLYIELENNSSRVEMSGWPRNNLLDVTIPNSIYSRPITTIYGPPCVITLPGEYSIGCLFDNKGKLQWNADIIKNITLPNTVKLTIFPNSDHTIIKSTSHGIAYDGINKCVTAIADHHDNVYTVKTYVKIPVTKQITVTTPITVDSGILKYACIEGRYSEGDTIYIPVIPGIDSVKVMVDETNIDIKLKDIQNKKELDIINSDSTLQINSTDLAKSIDTISSKGTGKLPSVTAQPRAYGTYVSTDGGSVGLLIDAIISGNMLIENNYTFDFSGNSSFDVNENKMHVRQGGRDATANELDWTCQNNTCKIGTPDGTIIPNVNNIILKAWVWVDKTLVVDGKVLAESSPSNYYTYTITKSKNETEYGISGAKYTISKGSLKVTTKHTYNNTYMIGSLLVDTNPGDVIEYMIVGQTKYTHDILYTSLPSPIGIDYQFTGEGVLQTGRVTIY